MRHIWVTLIIALTWIAASLTLNMGGVDALPVIVLSFAATFYFVLFGMQHLKD